MGAGRKASGAGTGGAVCGGQFHTGTATSDISGASVTTATGGGAGSGTTARITCTRRSGATAMSTVAALNADPLRTTMGASNGAMAWVSTVRASKQAHNRPAKVRDIRLNTPSR